VIEISDSGKDIFQRIKDGNGSFVTGVNNSNTGTAVIDGGAVTDPTAWGSSPTQNVDINFYVDATVQPPVTYYDLIDTDPASPTVGNSMLTGGLPVVPTTNPGPPPIFSGAPGLRTYVSGQAILLTASPTESPFDLGSNVIINGYPANGDVFTLQPSTTQDIFETLGTLITDLEQSTANGSQGALLSNRVGFALTNLDQSEQNILRVRALIGSRLQEVESLQGINEDVQIQYQQAISNLQDLDYAKAITDLTRKQTDLQAAQQSFSMISQLSLFDYI
jgi:flagellar hook-associated protein 3 FlgL